eukprot:3579699-Amphidinium_carterae.1
MYECVASHRQLCVGLLVLFIVIIAMLRPTVLNIVVPCARNPISQCFAVGHMRFAKVGQLCAEVLGKHASRLVMDRMNRIGPCVNTTAVKAPRIADDDVAVGFWATAHTLDVEARVRAAQPLLWIHIPKTGTSFAEAITHHKAFCSGLKPTSWGFEQMWTASLPRASCSLSVSPAPSSLSRGLTSFGDWQVGDSAAYKQDMPWCGAHTVEAPKCFRNSAM